MKEIRVIKIINSKKIVINVGSDDGIKEGDYFKIVDKISNESIIDPETGENLGNLAVYKGEVEATTVYKKMSIVEPPLKQISFSSLATISHSYRGDLDVDPKEITGGLPKSSHTPIQVGDQVIQIS